MPPVPVCPVCGRSEFGALRPFTTWALPLGDSILVCVLCYKVRVIWLIFLLKGIWSLRFRAIERAVGRLYYYCCLVEERDAAQASRQGQAPGKGEAS